MICLKFDKIRPGESQHEAGVRLRNEMLFRFCGIASPSVTEGSGQKPCLTDRQDISFSVSHSGNAVICALSFPGICETEGARLIYGGSDAPEVGADAELVRDASHTPRLRQMARRFFPEKDSARLDALTDGEYPRAFCEVWTAMESYVKMTGEGFRHGFSRIDLAAVRRVTDILKADGETYVFSVTF